MGKGSHRRPCQVSREEEDARWLAAFGPRPLREAWTFVVEKSEPFWTGPGYRGEYNCPHGVGHGNHTHGCDGCCSRDDFPLKGKPDESTESPNDIASPTDLHP